MELESAGAAPSRRRVLDFVLGAGVLGWMASIVYPVLRYLRPISPQGGPGPLRLSKEEVARLEHERSLILLSGTTRVLVFEDAEQKLRALEARCTHEGCTVQYASADSNVWCACHNGRFDLDGRVLSGPPPRPLAQWTAQREPDGAIVIAPAKRTEPA
jgi:cytochrome b6-f complex iron-sulfur subunit